VSGFTAFYDANVLYGSALRNFLMHLALTGLFRARWSAGVHQEWMTALLRNRPDLSREKLERTRMLMDRAAEDALVTGYEDLIEGLRLPDPDDRHVLAAAIRGRADVIVTANVRDFPAGVLLPFGIEAQHPDEFIVHLMDLSPGSVMAAAQRHRESLRNPAKTVAEYLEMLERESLAETVAVLRDYMVGGEEARF
jgi:predicted nucleic acid-binding protein